MPSLNTANQTEQIAPANPGRPGARIQNHGPGVLFVQKWMFPAGPNPDGVTRIEPLATLEDLPPGPVWKGPWYGQTDTAGTIYSVSEEAE